MTLHALVKGICEDSVGLMCRVERVPEHDEMFRLVELLGLLALVGQHIPDALAEMLVELRAQANAASEYHAQVDGRLASLPDEIAAGVDVDAMTKGMAESFRQQLATTGLENTANLLRDASKEIAGLSGQISASLKPGRPGIQGHRGNDLQRVGAAHIGVRCASETQHPTHGAGTIE